MPEENNVSSQTVASKSPFKMVLMYVLIAVAQATSKDFAAFIAPFDGYIESVQFVANTTLTGADTNTRKHSIVNKGAAGSGTNIAAVLQYNAGVTATANVKKTIPVEAADVGENYAPETAVLKGDVIIIKSDAVASGLADPGGIMSVTFARI